MDAIPLGALIAALFILLLLSAFFSGSETGMMALNRYRLRHLAESDHRGAKKASALLERPDRLLGLILVGNNFINIIAAYVAAFIAYRLIGETGIAVSAFVFPIILLVLAEVTPKTIAALHPERFAFPAAHLLQPLQTLLHPLVWATNAVSNRLLALLGVSPDDMDDKPLSREELRTVVNQAGSLIPNRHQRMLVNILDLEKITIDDIMVPRNEITGIDLDDPLDEIMDRIASSQHTRMPVYRGDINNIIGIAHLRRAARLFRDVAEIKPQDLEELADEPYFVPEGTGLHIQLRNFQKRKLRLALVVDEYGDVQGMVTLEDILEEIVGEFTTDPDDISEDVHPQEDGSFLVNGSATIRELNRAMEWELPADGPKTLNGVILEYLESIPETGTSLLINGYPVEIMQTTDSAVKMARISPELRRADEDEE